MSDTPETDNLARGNHVVPTEWAEKLERERNEARHEIVGWRNKWEAAIEMGARAMVERDDARENLRITQQAWVEAKTERVEALRERDKALNEMIQLQALELNNEGACVRLKRERDEARRERDEAREEIKELRDIAERAIELVVQLNDGPCEREGAKLLVELNDYGRRVLANEQGQLRREDSLPTMIAADTMTLEMPLASDTEKRGDCSSPSPGSAVSFISKTDSDAACSLEDQETQSTPSQVDSCPLAGEHPSHEYESPQVGLPHQSVRELLDASHDLEKRLEAIIQEHDKAFQEVFQHLAPDRSRADAGTPKSSKASSQSHPSDQRIVPPIHLGSGS